MNQAQQPLINQVRATNDKLGLLVSEMRQIKNRIPQPKHQEQGWISKLKFWNNLSLSISQKLAIFFVLLVIVGAIIYLSKNYSSIILKQGLQFLKGIFPLHQKVYQSQKRTENKVQEMFSKQNDLKKINSLIQSMKLPLNIKLYEGKFFKDAVYYQIKKIIKKNNQQISLISGKNGIGKTTSVKTILNEKRANKKNLDQVDMTLYISLNQLQNIKQFKQQVFYSQIWQLVKYWESPEKQHQSLNSMFRSSFSKKPLLIIVDQANKLEQFCQKICSIQIKSFLSDLQTLTTRGASIILLSSDPNFDYLKTISGLRGINFFKQQIIPEKNKALHEMFKYFNISTKNQKILLRNYNQRGRIIKLIKGIIKQKQKIQLKQIIKIKMKWQIQNIYDAIKQGQKGWKKRQNILLNICRQQKLSSEFVKDNRNQIRNFGRKNILYNTDFKYKLYLRAFEVYYQQVYPEKNKVKCVQRLPQNN